LIIAGKVAVDNNDVSVASATEATTQALAAAIAAVLVNGTVLALNGDLGAGKTVFSRGLARALGINDAISSPTFAIAQEYSRPQGSWFFHLDMYRLHGENDALAFGIEDYLFAPDAITVIEWPQRIAGLLESGRGTLWVLTLAHDRQTGGRRLTVPATLARAAGIA